MASSDFEVGGSQEAIAFAVNPSVKAGIGDQENFVLEKCRLAEGCEYSTSAIDQMPVPVVFYLSLYEPTQDVIGMCCLPYRYNIFRQRSSILVTCWVKSSVPARPTRYVTTYPNDPFKLNRD